MLAAELVEAGPNLRLILIERVGERSRMGWVPELAGAELMDVDLGKASLDEIVGLVKEVLPDVDDAEDIGAAIFRRSDGNLKSVWFQLRLTVSRREDQGTIPVSYEDVILTLPSLDQAVLRFIVFTIGGLTIANLVSLLYASDLHLLPDVVTGAITDLAALGLLVVNGETSDRVRVEHELVAQLVAEITPEEDKLELHAQAVGALTAVLNAGALPTDEATLFDRLLGIVSAVELRQSSSVLAHVVQFISTQSEMERHTYLASICRDSVCWDVLDMLPDTTVRALLDSIQKSSLFNFGLVATSRLRSSGTRHESVASLYEAKYLVQLFRYDEATAALERVHESKEKRTVTFNILLNLAKDDEAAGLASAVFAEVSRSTGNEQDYLILRNAGHLFPPSEARDLVDTALRGFHALGRRFGAATALNNLGIINLTDEGAGTARDQFKAARRELLELGSPEAYQPMVNLSAASLLARDYTRARRHLRSAREAAPRLLLQDRAMFDLNEIALDICGGSCSIADVGERLNSVANAARKTRDLRFIDVTVWFAETIDGMRPGRPAPSVHIDRRLRELRASPRTPLEVFVSAEVEGLAVEVPFVLSPHWRY
jgi:tetratricopeptide (TPR) repeat protein